jgi:hypothetical protein
MTKTPSAPHKSVAAAAKVQETDTKDKEIPTRIHMQDMRFLNFVHTSSTLIPQTVLTVCLVHSYVSDKPQFIRMHNHARGDTITGLPLRAGASICAKCEVTGGVRYVVSVGGGDSIFLKRPGETPADVIAANAGQIFEVVQTYFDGPRKAFGQLWKYEGVKVVKGDQFEDFNKFRPL